MQHQSGINIRTNQIIQEEILLPSKTKKGAEGKKDSTDVNRKTRRKTESKRRGIQRCLQAKSMQDQSCVLQVFVVDLLLRHKHTHECDWSGDRGVKEVPNHPHWALTLWQTVQPDMYNSSSLMIHLFILLSMLVQGCLPTHTHTVNTHVSYPKVLVPYTI